MVKKVTFEEAKQEALEFVRARGWDQTNTGRDLAISLSLESSELLEYFQWKDKPVGEKSDLESELADIFLYAIQFADKFDIDIPTAIVHKLEKQNKKYPVEITQIEDIEERRQAWLDAKKKYKKDTTL